MGATRRAQPRPTGPLPEMGLLASHHDGDLPIVPSARSHNERGSTQSRRLHHSIRRIAMTREERQAAIRKVLEEEPFVSVAELAARFHTSESTIRRD